MPLNLTIPSESFGTKRSEAVFGTGNLTPLHARVTDSAEFQQTTDYTYAGDRIRSCRR